jgi:hypothetical protein
MSLTPRTVRLDGPSTAYYQNNPRARAKKVRKQAKINSRPEERKRRAALNQERRQRGIYGKGGSDVSHTTSGATVLEDPSTNRARNGSGGKPRLKRDSIWAAGFDAADDGKKYTKVVTNPQTGRKNKVRYGAKGYKIAPGTSKGDRYCARSFGDMKSHGKDCAGADRNTPLCLSRSKWKCSGKTSRRDSTPEGGQKGKPCGESFIPKAYSCTKDTKGAAQTTAEPQKDRNLKLWAAAGLSAGAVAGIGYILYKDPQTRKELAFRLREDISRDPKKRFQIRDAIDSYTRGSYTLNTQLRTGRDTKDVQPIISGLDKWFARSKATQGIYYRGFNSGGTEASIWENMRVGDTYSDKGYGSFSTSRKIGEDFSGLFNKQEGYLIVARGGAYPIPYGIKGSGRFPVGTGYAPEKEALMPRGTTYKITKINKMYYRMRYSSITNESERSPKGKDVGNIKVIYVDILDRPAPPRRANPRTQRGGAASTSLSQRVRSILGRSGNKNMSQEAALRQAKKEISNLTNKA